MNVQFLREDVLEYGPDLATWPIDRRRAAVLELYRQDEATGAKGRNASGTSPQWLMDAIADAACSPSWRAAVLSALSPGDVIDQASGALSALRVAVFDYPVDWLSQQAQLHEEIWREEDRLERWVGELEAREDARREEQLLEDRP